MVEEDGADRSMTISSSVENAKNSTYPGHRLSFNFVFALEQEMKKKSTT